MTALSAESTFGPFPLGSVPASTGFDYPVGGALHYEGFTIYNCFGCDLDSPGFQGHTGEDFFNARAGDPVYAVSEGTVVFSGMGPGLWGNIVIIQHKARGVTVFSQYAHLTNSYVRAGQVVGRRQVIGTVGETGTTEPHLHFEIKDLAKIGHGYTGIGFLGRTTIHSMDIGYFMPSWYIETYRYLDSPYGAIDWVRRVPRGFKISGWGFDPNTTEPIEVNILIDGQMTLALTASEDRPDIGQSFPGMGNAHGFSATIAAASGVHTVCAQGINKGAGSDNIVACQQIEVGGNPYGSVDSATLDGTGQIVASGWAVDPDTAAPAQVKLTANGRLLGVVNAADRRADVEAAYPEYGPWHGFSATLPVLAGETDVCAWGTNAGSGADTLIGCRTVRGGWDSYPTSAPPAGRHYYWPWYDSQGGSDWILMGSPASGQALAVDLNIAGMSLDLHPFGGPSVPAPGTLAATYGTLTGGPVVATSLGGAQAIASQRTLWGGSSLEEVPGIDEARLSSHYYWTWYDQLSPGMQNWVLVANPGDVPVYYEITIAGADPGTGSKGAIAPGQHVTPTFPGQIAGPVEVKAWTNDTKTTEARVIASQRVLSDYGSAFNEAPGIPAEELSAHYLWTWYDDVAGADWLLIANPGDTEDMYYEVTLAGEVVDQDNGSPIAAGAHIARRYGRVGGPLKLTTWQDPAHTQPLKSVASQRVIWGPSFGETPGYPHEQLSDSYYWTWYDQQSPGMTNWVLIANPGQQSIYYELTINGADPGPGASGTILPGGNVTPTFPSRMGGPVQVRAWTDATKTTPADIIASQRVLYNGYFNEVVGVVLR
ncbi:MAG: M23 family metallopeptidase [Thermoleophilia bacterium]